MKHITQPIPDIRKIQPDLPLGCSVVIDQALAKEPDKRFSSATELAQALLESPKQNAKDAPKPATPTRTLKLKRLQTKPLSIDADVDKKDTSDIIVCPKCKTKNAAQKRLCISCGERLKVNCPLCFTLNQVDAVSCAKCGANLHQLKSQQRVIEKARKDSLAKRDQALRAKASQQLREKITSLLSDINNRKNRTAALRKLDQLLTPAIKTLGGHLLDPDSIEARSESAVVLSKLYDRPELDTETKAQIVAVLVDALEVPDQELRLQVEELLEDIGNRRSREISNIFKGLVGWIKGD